MRIKSLTDALIYLAEIAGALMVIGGLLRAVVVKPLKSWITVQVAKPTPHSIALTAKLDMVDQRITDHLQNHPS